MLEAVIGVLGPFLEVLLWGFVGPRREPSTSSLKVLGDIDPRPR